MCSSTEAVNEVKCGEGFLQLFRAAQTRSRVQRWENRCITSSYLSICLLLGNTWVPSTAETELRLAAAPSWTNTKTAFTLHPSASWNRSEIAAGPSQKVVTHQGQQLQIVIHSHAADQCVSSGIKTRRLRPPSYLTFGWCAWNKPFWRHCAFRRKALGTGSVQSAALITSHVSVGGGQGKAGSERWLGATGMEALLGYLSEMNSV